MKRKIVVSELVTRTPPPLDAEMSFAPPLDAEMSFLSHANETHLQEQF